MYTIKIIEAESRKIRKTLAFASYEWAERELSIVIASDGFEPIYIGGKVTGYVNFNERLELHTNF